MSAGAREGPETINRAIGHDSNQLLGVTPARRATAAKPGCEKFAP